MIVKMKDGFSVNVNEECSNDWDFLTKLRKIDKGDAGLIVDVAEILLGGEEEVEKLAEHLKKDGLTRLDAMVDALTEIMESASSVKNS